MAESESGLFYKPSKNRGVVPCEHWSFFVVHELKTATVRLLGPPIRSPESRYAIHVIDRSDGKQRVLEGPHELFEQFPVYSKNTGCNPSGPEAPDFRIVLAARPYRYLITPLAMTMLTFQEQVDMVGETLNLGKIYRVGQDMHVLDVAARLWVPACRQAPPHPDRPRSGPAEPSQHCLPLINMPATPAAPGQRTRSARWAPSVQPKTDSVDGRGRVSQRCPLRVGVHVPRFFASGIAGLLANR